MLFALRSPRARRPVAASRPRLEVLEDRFLLAAPTAWDNRGVGGGGALYSPSIGYSDPSEMYRSLTQRLGALPDETVLFPGHNYGGTASTIGEQKRSNPFMQFASLGDFLRMMSPLVRPR